MFHVEHAPAGGSARSQRALRLNRLDVPIQHAHNSHRLFQLSRYLVFVVYDQ